VGKSLKTPKFIRLEQGKNLAEWDQNKALLCADTIVVAVIALYVGLLPGGREKPCLVAPKFIAHRTFT